MKGWGRFALMAVLAATLLHGFPLFALAAPGQQRCHHQEKSKPARPTPANDVCCAIHRSMILQPSCVPQAPNLATEGIARRVSVDVSLHLQLPTPLEISSAPPGSEPLRI